MMSLQQFAAEGEKLGARAGVLNGSHGYFQSHITRLHKSCELFGLFSSDLGNVLDIGPFFSYTPILLRSRSSTYTILEGDVEATRPLEPLYKERGINFQHVDFFELFGPFQSAPHKLPLADASFDTILCWETMEHFNFNPVKFVRELHRVLKPGGRACITVPNRASFQQIVATLFGRGEKAQIQSYYQFENATVAGKKVFYGFHWREYSGPELLELFASTGFKVHGGSFMAFRDGERLNFPRRCARMFASAGTKLFPRYATHIYLTATK